MKILDVVQGSPEWLAARSKHFCASDAPAMMGVSRFVSRTDFVRMLATGEVPEVDQFKQELFDRGHAAEAAARPLVENMLGEELYPTVGTDDAGYLLASFDGITMAGDTAFEHKLWNEELAEAVRIGNLPPAYFWQLEEQILVGGLDKVIFVCSDGTEDKFVYTEYRAVAGRAEQLLAGWKQLEDDVKNYQHVEVIPAAVAMPTKQLPAVSVLVKGSIAVQSNLDLFGQQLNAFIAGINMKPADDQAFADCEGAIKTLKEAQAALEQAEQSALAQTASIDDMRRTVALYVETARTTRLTLEKLVQAQKENIRAQILQGGKDAFATHVAGLNNRLGKPYMPTVPVEFAGVMKGKRTIASLRDAVNTELARAKIEANAVADRIQINLATLRELAIDHIALFADTAQIVLKPCDDLTTLVKLRIAEHKEREAKREEATRERIRQEELAKLQREEAARQAAAVAAAAAAAQPAPAPAPTPTPTPAAITSAPAPATTPAPAQVSRPAAVIPLKAAAARPSDDEIIASLALNFRVHESKVIAWLLDMDLDAASERMATEFAA